MQLRRFMKVLNTKVELYRKKNQGDKYGGVDTVWDKYAWDVPARIVGRSGVFSIEVEGVKYNVSHTCMISQEEDVRMGDRVIDVSTNRKYFCVRSEKANTTHKIHHSELTLAEMNE